MLSVPESLSAIGGLLVLLPGFITFIVERSLVRQADPSATLVIARSLVYSLLNYMVFSLTRAPLFTSRPLADQEDGLSILPSPFGGLLLVAIAVAMGLLVGVSKNQDWHMSAARWLRLTRRTSREGMWLDIFHDKYPGRGGKGPYVVVTLKDGRRLDGWPEYYSDEYSEGPVLFLSQAQWLRENCEASEVPPPGILLNGSQIEFMQFYDVTPGGEQRGREGNGQSAETC